MNSYTHILWGYELKVPDSWVHQQALDADIFAASTEALDSNFDGDDAGQIIIRGEWNWAQKNIEPLWYPHIAKVAGMLSARNIGSAPWKIGEATGLEAEIVLPKKDKRRLWMGILMHDFRVLHFLVTHPKEIRDRFEPEASNIIKSLLFPEQIPGAKASPEDLPLPPDYSAVAPQSLLDDIDDSMAWRAYSGNAGIGSLQAFYLRELTQNGWKIEEYVPLTESSELGFVRYKISREETRLTLGLLPSDDSGADEWSKRANILYKIN